MKRLLVAAVFAMALTACGGSTAPTTTTSAPARKLQVTVTTTQLADFVRTVGGDRVNVYQMLKPGVAVHNYVPLPDDVTAVANADLIVQNGAGLEPWFDSLIQNSDRHGVIVDASTGVVLRSASNGSGNDPHIWHNIDNAKLMVANVSNALQAADGQSKSQYQANERAYDSQLAALDASITSAFSSLQNKELVTVHDAMGYFSDRYQLDYVGTVLGGKDGATTPTDAQRSALVTQIGAKKAKAIFADTAFSTVSAAAVASSSNVKLIAGSGALYGESLGAVGSDGGTYLKAEQHNADAIVNALNG